MHHLAIKAILVSTALLFPLLGGCLNLDGENPPVRRYMLMGMEEELPEHRAESGIARSIIQLGPVIVPEYLDRPQIVSHAIGNELYLAEFDRWGEPLKDNIARVLAGNLSALLQTESFVLYPWQLKAEESFQVKVQILRFDGALGGEVLLKAQWSLLKGDGTPIMPLQKNTMRDRVGGPGHAALVSAMNRALNNLSREMAMQIRPHLPE